MGQLLDEDTLSNLLPPGDRKALGDSMGVYLQGILAGIHDDITGYLAFDPALTIHQNESGVATLIVGGPYAGRYFLELRGAPLVPGPASSIFQSLSFTYAAALIDPAQAPLQYTEVDHESAEVFALAPGQAEGLAGVHFGFGDTAPTVSAVGYQATYAAGWATGIKDPVPNGGGSGFSGTLTVVGGLVQSATIVSGGLGYTNPPFFVVQGSGYGAVVQGTVDNNVRGGPGVITRLQVLWGGSAYDQNTVLTINPATSFYADPIPDAITRAAVLLVREYLAFEAPLVGQPISPLGGVLVEQRSADAMRRYQQLPLAKGEKSLGYETMLAKRAKRHLDQWQRKRYFTWIV